MSWCVVTTNTLFTVLVLSKHYKVTIRQSIIFTVLKSFHYIMHTISIKLKDIFRCCFNSNRFILTFLQVWQWLWSTGQAPNNSFCQFSSNQGLSPVAENATAAAANIVVGVVLKHTIINVLYRYQCLSYQFAVVFFFLSLQKDGGW